MGERSGSICAKLFLYFWNKKEFAHMKKEKNFHYLLPELIAMSQSAGDAIMKVYMREHRGVVKKADNSPLTDADLAANEIICRGLEEITPDIPIISEENTSIPFEIRKNWEYLWLVDPLDGTKEFVNRTDEFTTNIALIKRGKPILGVVYAPVSQEMFYAVAGHGAYRKVGESIERIKVRSYDADSDSIVVMTSRSHINQDTLKYLKNWSQPELTPKGSSLKFLEIAQGEADIYPRLGPTMEWDTAAAHIILEEAGGTIKTFKLGKKLKYNKENLKNPYFIARGDKK